MASETKVKVDDARAARVLFDALKERSRGQTALVRLTPADAVALTGLPSEQAEPALKSLVAAYRSHLSVTDDGDLIYEFDPALERRDRVPLGERLRAAGQLAWKGFQGLFKVWIVVTLVVYVLAFLAMMISLMVARSSDDRDDRRGGGGFPWLWYWLMPDLAPRRYYRDPYGRLLERPRQQKRFYQSVFDFVFGPKGALPDPREGDRRTIAFLRDHKGRITAAELSALTGRSLRAAEEELTRLMVEYDGEVEVTDAGVLVYVFDELLPSAASLPASAPAGWSWDWERSEPLPALTGNTAGTNAVIAGFSGFNLLASLTIGPAFLMRFGLYEEPLAQFFITVFPLIFSAIFFAVPAARWVARRRELKRRDRRRLRRALLREIWSRPSEPQDPVALASGAATASGLPEPAAARLLDELMAELDGDVTTDDEGHTRYRFPRLDEEKREVAKARALAPARALGEVVFSSADDKGGGGQDG